MLAWLLWPKPPIVYADMQEAWVGIKAEGFHCVADREDGLIGTGFMVSRERATFDDVTDICMAGPMKEHWKGVVWVRKHVQPENWTMPDDADMRVWGGVCVFGDKDFLAEIEAVLQQRFRAPVM
jgi:hypothetical protein